ncbi:MAG: imidazole glycerol phosphate synthase subunit HisF [Thermoplasmatota archaeon]
MTLRKRIVPCLDVDGGRVVKGVNFLHLRDVGDPVTLATAYEAQGADEIVFLDISATHEGRATTLDVVRRTAEQLFIPLTVGGGVRSIQDIRATLHAGADKVAINSAALQNPDLIAEGAALFGSQCIVLAVDAKWTGSQWNVHSHGGRTDTGRELLSWCLEAQELGAGEILLTSMDGDGTRKGFDVPMMQAVTNAVRIPVIASGGCGTPEHMREAFEAGASAALAASIFHDGDQTVGTVKAHLAAAGVPVR